MIDAASVLLIDGNSGIQKDGGEIYLGKGFTGYVMEDGKLGVGDGGISFPAIQDGKVVLILTIFPEDTESGWSVHASYGVGERLNETQIFNSSEPSIVVYNGYGVGYVLNKEFALFDGNEIDRDPKITFAHTEIRKKVLQLNTVNILERLEK